MKRSHFSLLTVLLIAFTVFTACESKKAEDQKSASTLEKAPNFEVITISGETISLEESLSN
ncbi:MAG: hypothetical protein RI564_13535, partial [Gracilimonas sp.]|nr:hypothetical protein [Gracilimonas sp.]